MTRWHSKRIDSKAALKQKYVKTEKAAFRAINTR
jgi:hypothetical protein